MKNNLISIALAGSLALGLTGCNKRPNPDNFDLIRQYNVGCQFEVCDNKKIHNLTKGMEFEEGYLNLNYIIFQVRDQDQNDKNELVMQYEGKRYLVKMDSKTSNAVLIPYLKKNEIVEERK